MNRTNLGIFIKNNGSVKFHNTKISDMFTTTLVDPDNAEEIDYLDKDYCYIKKFMSIESLEMLQNRNEMSAIKARANSRMLNLSLNQAMSLITEDLSLKGIFHFQVKQSSLSLDQLLLINSTGIQFARDSVS